MNLAKNNIVTWANSSWPLALSIDYTNKVVYWVSGRGVSYSGYDGKTTTILKSGSFNHFLLGIFEDSVYFQEWNVPYINEMNITSGNISRSINVDKTDYPDLVIFHNSLQTMGKLQKSYQYSWIYCDVTYLSGSQL